MIYKKSRGFPRDFLLMMEKSHTGEAHNHAVFVTAVDYNVVTDRAARLCNIGYAAL